MRTARQSEVARERDVALGDAELDQVSGGMLPGKKKPPSPT